MTPTHIREGYWGIGCPTYIIEPEFSFEESFVHMMKHREGHDKLVIRGFSINRPSVPCRSFIRLKPGNWQIVCLSGEITEKIAKQIVEGNEEYKGIWIYKDYTNGKALHDATASFYSLLRSLGLPETTTLILKKL
jgi:hypothetical protein